MSLKNIEHCATRIKELKAKLHQFNHLIKQEKCLLAYAADLPYTVVDGPQETIVPRVIDGTREQIRDHALAVFESLDYLDETQHEKNTARSVGIVHLQCDKTIRIRIIHACANIQHLKFTLSQRIKLLSEIERRKLKRLDDLEHINFQQVSRPIHIYSHQLCSAAFTWLAHSSTVQKHRPGDYLVYLERIKAGLHTAALRADPGSALQGDINKALHSIDSDIAQISLHMTRRAIYVRREVPPHPRVRLGTYQPLIGDECTLEYNVRSCPMPLITFSNEYFDEATDALPMIKPLGILSAKEKRTERRSDLIYTPILEHRNVYVRDRVPKHPASRKRRTATRLAS